MRLIDFNAVLWLLVMIGDGSFHLSSVDCQFKLEFEGRHEKIDNLIFRRNCEYTKPATMRVSTIALASLSLLPDNCGAFRPIQISRSSIALKNSNNLHEFDYLLTENSELNIQQQSRSRRRVYLNDDRHTVLVSTTFAAPGMEEEAAQEEADPYADIGLEQPNPQALKIEEQNQSMSQKFENRLKTMDLQDIVATLVIPSIIAFAGLRWGFNKVSGRVSASKDSTLDDFAKELIYHDGDFEEMKLCHSDYSKKLVWLGPQKTQAMLKSYLELYAKKRTVSPQAIR